MRGEPLIRRLKAWASPMLKNPRINALRGVPMPDVTGEAAQRAIARMIVEGGRLVARVGETEGRATAHYLMRRMAEGDVLPYAALNRERLKALAGYFPITDDAIDRLAQTYLAAIRRIDLYAAWTPHDRLLCPRDALRCTLRDIDPFFTVTRWPKACAGRRVTIVSPFKTTIVAQWQRRALLFAQPMMPECDLTVVQAPQTQCETAVAGQDWFDHLRRLDDAVAATAPHAVIIGAGAYGLPLGAMAAARGATAIVMGGSTQLLFGIMGNRWARDREYRALQNEHWTRPGQDERPIGFEQFETAGGAYW